MKNQTYLLTDLALNTATTCTLEEAVALILNLETPNLFVDESCTNKDELNLFGGSKKFSLNELLIIHRSWYQMQYSESQDDKHLMDIYTFDNDYVKQAKIHLCVLADELAKGTDSELRCIDDKITLTSLDKWTQKHLDISIFDNINFNVAKVGNTPKKPEPVPEQPVPMLKTRTAINSFLITFDTLLEKFLSTQPNPGKLFRGGKRNVSAVGKFLQQKDIPGQDWESIKTIIEKAAKAKAEVVPEEHEPVSSKTKELTF
jgi:hypothetical protein